MSSEDNNEHKKTKLRQIFLVLTCIMFTAGIELFVISAIFGITNLNESGDYIFWFEIIGHILCGCGIISAILYRYFGPSGKN